MTHFDSIEQIKDYVNNSLGVVYWESLNYFVDIDKDGLFVIRCNVSPARELLTDNHNPKDFFILGEL